MTNANIKSVLITDEKHTMNGQVVEVTEIIGTTIRANDPTSDFGGQLILHTSQVSFETKVFVEDDSLTLNRWVLDVVSVYGTTIYAHDPRSDLGGQIILHTSQVLFCK